MKTIISLILIFCVTILCACTEDVPEYSYESFESSETNEISKENSESKLNISEYNLVPMNHSQATPFAPAATTAETLSEEDCIALAYDMYDDVLSIAKEFYGFPDYLVGVPGSEQIIDGVAYYQIRCRTDGKITSSIEFQNDADMLRNLVDFYFTDQLISSAFSLEYPCAIFAEDGVLYGTSHEPNTANTGCDISAGRIISRDNGIVRFGFPIFNIDYNTNKPDEDFWIFGYMDFVYEDEKWKINDFRLSREHYSHSDFPGGLAEIRMDDFFTLDDNKEIEGVEINLDGEKNVSIEFSGKSITAELTKRASKINGIEKAGGNIFVSFLGAFGELETLVVSEADATISTRFVSNGFCTTENGDWYYLTVDRENRLCDILDKSGTPIHGFAAIKQELAQYRSLPEIAPIDDIELDEDGFTIIYDITGY